MEDVNIADFAAVGARLLELGEKLKTLRGQRNDIQEQITAIETELVPLVVKHSKFLADLVGTALPAALAAPQQNNPGQPLLSPPSATANEGIKKRVIQYLQRSEQGVGAIEVADALKIDVMLVRQAMMEMRQHQAKDATLEPG